MAKKYVTIATRKAPGGMSVKRPGKVRKTTARGVIADPEPKSMYSIKAKRGG
jgi:hypothetical protein